MLYAYNADVIDSSSLPETINPYTSPLDKLWEIKLTKEASATGGNSSLSAGATVGIVIGCFAGVWLAIVAALFGTKKISIATIKRIIKKFKNRNNESLEYDNDVLLDEDGEYIILEEEVYVEEDVLVDIDE